VAGQLFSAHFFLHRLLPGSLLHNGLGSVCILVSLSVKNERTSNKNPHFWRVSLLVLVHKTRVLTLSEEKSYVASFMHTFHTTPRTQQCNCTIHKNCGKTLGHPACLQNILRRRYRRRYRRRKPQGVCLGERCAIFLGYTMVAAER